MHLSISDLSISDACRLVVHLSISDALVTLVVD